MFKSKKGNYLMNTKEKQWVVGEKIRFWSAGLRVKLDFTVD